MECMPTHRHPLTHTFPGAAEQHTMYAEPSSSTSLHHLSPPRAVKVITEDAASAVSESGSNKFAFSFKREKREKANFRALRRRNPHPRLPHLPLSSLRISLPPPLLQMLFQSIT
jgi:hypothetical protein